MDLQVTPPAYLYDLYGSGSPSSTVGWRNMVNLGGELQYENFTATAPEMIVEGKASQSH